MLKPPNLFLGLLWVATKLIWRNPVATTGAKPKPKPPRRPTFNFVQNVVPDEIHSIIRTTWFKNGRAIEVDQLFLMEDEQATEIFQYLVGGALRQGCDVTVMTTYSPEALGVPRE
jgi:hypothetical protein